MKKVNVPIDEIAETIAAFGVPGLVFVGAVGATGLSGAAAVTAALAALGPGGMVCGIVFLGFLGFIARYVSEFGVSAICKAVIIQLRKNGETPESIKRKIMGYHLSKSMKMELLGYFDAAMNESDDVSPAAA